MNPCKRSQLLDVLRLRPDRGASFSVPGPFPGRTAACIAPLDLPKGVCINFMDLSFTSFWGQLVGNPILIITVAFTLGVIFVNGWTDAPNAIATCVTTRCLGVRQAIWMSALFNFLGVFVMTQINSSVASTISNMVDFGADTSSALIALCAALLSIVVYSVGASIFGIPTSESHSLIAGLSGAAIAIQGGVGGINFNEWVKVLYGVWPSACCWVLPPAGSSASWSPSCAATSSCAPPTGFSGWPRSPAPQA